MKYQYYGFQLVYFGRVTSKHWCEYNNLHYLKLQFSFKSLRSSISLLFPVSLLNLQPAWTVITSEIIEREEVLQSWRTNDLLFALTGSVSIYLRRQPESLGAVIQILQSAWPALAIFIIFLFSYFPLGRLSLSRSNRTF